MAEGDRKRVVDAFAWALNIFASVAIVMVNKQLMGSAGYGFSFGMFSYDGRRSPRVVIQLPPGVPP